MIKVPRKEFLRILNLWMDEKQGYCERNNHFCGVMGYTSANRAELIGDIDIIDEVTEDNITYKDVPLILVTEFDGHIDMEHG